MINPISMIDSTISPHIGRAGLHTMDKYINITVKRYAHNTMCAPSRIILLDIINRQCSLLDCI